MADATERYRAYRFALDPTKAQEAELERHAGAQRWAYNFGVQLRTEAQRAWHERVTVLIGRGHSEDEARDILRLETLAHQKAVRDMAAEVKALRAQMRSVSPEEKALLRQEIDDLTQRRTALIRGSLRAGLARILSPMDIAELWRAVRDLPANEGGSPWYSAVCSYVFSSGFEAAWADWKRYLDGRQGRPVLKRKGRCRHAFTLYHNSKKPGIRAERATSNFQGHRPSGSRYRGLTLPRLGNIRCISSTRRLVRAIDAGHVTVKSVTVARAGERWYATVRCEMHHPLQAGPSRRQRSNGTVGVKWGPRELTLHHDGRTETLPQPQYLRQGARTLARAQAAASRTRPDSRGRTAATARVARIHHAIAERRRGWLDQVTTRLAKNFATVAIEQLNLKTLMRSARSAQRKQILDSAPGTMHRILAYKTDWRGAQLALTEVYFPTTRICSKCGRQNPRRTPSGQQFSCTACLAVLPRAANAAKVIAQHAVPAAREAAPDTEEAQNARGADADPPVGRRRQ